MQLDPQDLQLSQAQAQRRPARGRNQPRPGQRRTEALPGTARARISSARPCSTPSSPPSRRRRPTSTRRRPAIRGQSQPGRLRHAGVRHRRRGHGGRRRSRARWSRPARRWCGWPRPDDKEIVIGLPEDKVDALRKVEDVTVRLWADPSTAIPGKIREVSPVADPATRTYAGQGVDSGQRGRRQAGHDGAGAVLVDHARRRVIRVPLTALFHEKGDHLGVGGRKRRGAAWCRCRSAARPATTWCWPAASSPARPWSRPASTCSSRARRSRS